MNKNLTKGLIIGAVITAIILHQRIKKKNEEIALLETYNQNLNLLQETEVSGPEILPKNEEFIKLNDECVLIGDMKATFNHWIQSERMDTNDIYDSITRDIFKKLFEGTTNIIYENDDLRKMMIFDLVKTNSNIIEVDILPRPLKYEYTPGVLSLGDKGAEVSKLQELINKLYKYVYPETEQKIMVNSTYDKTTKDAVVKLFNETSALIDNTKGTISKEFVSNFNIILENLKLVN